MKQRANSLHGVGRTARRAAFTLIEMVLALSIFVLLIAGIFAIANGTLELSNDLTYAQERAMMRQNLVEFFRKSFRTLPGDAALELKVKSVGGSYLPTLSIYNGGTSFSPGPALSPESSVEVYTEERPGGYLRIGIRGLDADQTQAALQNKPVKVDKRAELPLLDNVARFEWKFYDARSGQWESNWQHQRGRPMFAELNLALDDGQEIRAVFWIPPIVRRSLSGVPVMAAPGQQPGAVGPNGAPVQPPQPVTQP